MDRRCRSEDIDDLPIPSLATPDGQRVVETELAAYPAIGLIVIDYLQLMQAPGEGENRATEISAISRSGGSEEFGARTPAPIPSSRRRRSCT